MAHLRINSVDIEGFMSIGRARLEFDNQGIVLVKGINKFEERSNSNGSGKSAVFESIIWALTGYTSRGSSNIVNRFTSTGTKVLINFDLDACNYLVCRTEKHESMKTSLTVYKNGEDISGSTTTKSKSVLKDELSSLTYEILTSIVILSQGLPGRLSSLKPSQRKSRLEELSSMDSYVEELDTKVSRISKELNSKSVELNRVLAETSGRLNAVIELRDRNMRKIEESKHQSSNLISEEEFEKYSRRLEEISEIKQDVSQKFRTCNQRIMVASSKKSEISNKMTSIKQELLLRMTELDNLSSGGICPTCNQLISNTELINKLRSDIDIQVKTSSEKLKELARELVNLNDEIDSCNSQLELLEISSREVSTEEIEINNKLVVYREHAVVLESLLDSVRESEEVEKECNKILSDTRKELSNVESEIEKLNYIKKSISRKFRTFLLEGVVNYINHKCKEYSRYIFTENGDVSLELNGNNIDIKLGEQKFEELSGGESRRVDIILQIVQRDLAKNEAGISSNILILDEILDYLDSEGIDSVLRLIETKSTDVGTIMIVTHKNDVSIPYDSVMTVVKDRDRISYVERV